ncbi:type VII secretion protein EccB [Dactylosporangium sp. AC04546]|uniref:type VII secretion protein EccB n=1 Tax=Dactylosporangium sp. AC04546 TaxID=2862460 RepID=UPI001EDCD5FB|nr:type VII secretion protein EccB [Dactylosporangium sp. AC04546]WVK80648.1 type VII secretion protein EccB [Dactylosporangium sp. AC04546]
MASRKDQLHAYQFLVQRVISAFVMRETDPAQSPLRRGVGAVFAGLMVAIVVGAAYGVYGLITKVGGNGWRADGAVVIEKETGASFVYVAGRLHPTLNYASALLLSGRPGAPVFRVSHSALAGVPRAVTVGIPGAPNSLPPAASAVGLPWSMCTAEAVSASGAATTVTSLVVGHEPTGGTTVDAEHAVLARDAVAGQRFLVWRGHRYALAEAVVPALFGATARSVPVGTAWLNALPVGADIGPIVVLRRGELASAVPDRRIGDLLAAPTAAGPQYYLVFDDGLAPLTSLQQALLAAQAAVRPIEITVAIASAAPRSSALPTAEGVTAPPQRTPVLVEPEPDGLVCASTVNARAEPVVRLGGAHAALNAGIPTAGRSGTGASLADRVAVPAGAVAVIRVLPSPDAEVGTYSIVTDLGVRYPVPSGEVLGFLGYSAARAVDVPVALAQRLPTGPTLDPAQALLPVVG